MLTLGSYYSLGTSWLSYKKAALAGALAGVIVVILSVKCENSLCCLPSRWQVASRGLGEECTRASGKGLKTGKATPCCRWDVPEGPALLCSRKALVAMLKLLLGCCFYDPRPRNSWVWEVSGQDLGQLLFPGSSMQSAIEVLMTYSLRPRNPRVA